MAKNVVPVHISSYDIYTIDKNPGLNTCRASEKTPERLFSFRGIWEEKHRQGASFFFTTRKHNELVLPG